MHVNIHCVKLGNLLENDYKIVASYQLPQPGTRGLFSVILVGCGPVGRAPDGEPCMEAVPRVTLQSSLSSKPRNPLMGFSGGTVHASKVVSCAGSRRLLE